MYIILTREKDFITISTHLTPLSPLLAKERGRHTCLP